MATLKQWHGPQVGWVPMQNNVFALKGSTPAAAVGNYATVISSTTEGETVYWPEGVHIITGNLGQDFYRRDNKGPGTLALPGGGTYHVTPTRLEQNQIYVDAAAPAGGDGLTWGTAMNSLAALDVWFRFMGEGALRGRWQINLRGTFTRGQTFRYVPNFVAPLVIEGEALVGGVPVTTIQMGTGSETYALRFEPGRDVTVRNLLVKDFRDNGFGRGVNMKQGGYLRCENVHFNNCDVGGDASDNVRFYFGGCHAQDCRTGMQGVYSSSGAFGGASAPSTADNCERGVHVSRNAVAHVDYFTATDCLYGVNLEMQSRIGMIASHFKRNTIGVRCTGGSELNLIPDTGGGNQFYEGTADANDLNYSFEGVSGETRLHRMNTKNEYIIHTHNQMVATGNGASEVLATSVTGNANGVLPAHFMADTPRKIRLRATGQLAGAGSKTLTFAKQRRNGTSVGTLQQLTGLTGAGFFTWEVEALVTSDNQVRVTSTFMLDGQPARVNVRTAGHSIDHEWAFQIAANSGNTDSTVYVYSFEVFCSG